MAVPAILTHLQVDPETNTTDTDVTRKWALRASGCWLGRKLRQSFGLNWGEELGLDLGRVDQWCSSASEGTSIPAPREVLAMAYVLGLHADLALQVMVGQADLSVLQPKTDPSGVSDRLQMIIRGAQVAVKAYRAEELARLLERLQDRYTPSETRKYLAGRLGVSESSLGQMLKDNVALSAWSDATLAFEMGVRISDHWRLGRVLADRAYLRTIDQAHALLAQTRRGLVELAMGSLDELCIGCDDIERSYIMINFSKPMGLSDMLSYRHLDGHLILANGDTRWSLQVVQQRVNSEIAREVGVDEDPWLEFRLYRLDEEGWVVGKKIEGCPASWEELEVALDCCLPQGTCAVGVKLIIPDAKRAALASGKKIVVIR